MKIEIEIHVNYPDHLGFKTFMKYYAKRYIVSQEYDNNRSTIFNFKGGAINTQVDHLYVNAINELKQKYPNCEFWLCPIPASNVVENKNRFEDFINRVSGQSQIKNGYSLLQAIRDRPKVHVGGARDYSQLLECTSFNNISGKNIILCDDVATIGRSYRTFANHLHSLGAAYVVGIFLGKTHWP